MAPQNPYDPSQGNQQPPDGAPGNGGYIAPPSADINLQNAPTIRTPQPSTPPEYYLSPTHLYYGGQPYAPPPLHRPHMPAWALVGGGAIAALVIVALVVKFYPFGAVTTPQRTQGTGQPSTFATPTLPGATPTFVTNTPMPTTQSTPIPPSQIAPLVSVGSPLYETTAPGQCDQHGATWAANPYASQACVSGALQMTGLGNCNCPIGIVALEQLPSTYPTQYVVQVSINSSGAGATNRFGFKFYQASDSNPPDTGLARGGYAFLIASDGAWQFNSYTADGTLTTVDTGMYGAGVAGQHTLDLSVGPSSFGFYVDGNLVATEYDTTYTSGLIDLVTESGAVVLFQNFALYSQPG